MKRLSLALIPLAVSMLAFTSPLAAQSLNAALAGEVTDVNARPINAAEVSLTSDETGQVRTTSTDREGGFSLPAIQPGRYRLEVTSEGYRRSIRTLDILVNQQLRLGVALTTGPRTESIEVEDVAPVLRTESGALSTVIDNRQVRGLPLDGRNYLELSLLAPGTAPAAQGSAGSVRGDFALNVNGSRESANNFLLDGIYNGDPKLNTFGVTPSVDAVREFELLTNAYDASFGRNPGAQVNVVINSGTNQLHGTAYEFFRNSALDARNYFAPSTEPKPKNNRNQFGGSLGGPIIHNKTFFFVDYEGRRVREGITRVTNVPTALERQGDFSQSLLPANDPFFQVPYPGNRIPVERQHPIGRAIAALYPLPNRNVQGLNFVSSPTQQDRNDQFDVRLDHTLTQRSQLSFRYSLADREFFEPFATGTSFPAIPGYGNQVPRRGQNVLLSETHTFSPRLINELRLGFNRVAAGVYQENNDINLNSQVGLPTLSTRERDFGLSNITILGYSPLGHEFNNPQFSATNSYQINDQASYAAGRHLIKFGFDVRYLQQNAFRDVQSRGFLNFVGFTGNSLAELLQGLPAVSGGARLDNPQHLRTTSYNFFIQDNFRIRPDLTINLGLRYEVNTPPNDAFDRANLYNDQTGQLAPVGQNGLPRGGYEIDRNNFGPRVGLAWSPGRGKTVIRAGYGVYFDQSPLAPGEGLYFSPPYYNFNLYFTSQAYFLSLSNPFPSDFPLFVPNSATAFQRDLRTPYVQHWNFNVQQQIGTARTLEVGYVGSSGTKLLAGRDINQPRPSVVFPNLRPNPLFDDINRIESRSVSNYNSLQARLQQRYHNGLSLLASYTWSKSIDDASNFFPSTGDPSYPQDSLNAAAERARSSFDVAHRLSVSYSYDLPIAKGHALWGGWQTFGILSFQTGRPFTVALSQQNDNSNTGRSVLGFGANDRPNIVGNPKIDDPSPDRWFNTSAFAIPPFGTFGNAGRNILEGPGLATVNLSLVKDTRFTERVTTQLRLETFNLFNRTNFDLPDLYVESPTFGRIQSAGTPRRIQLGVKLLF